MNNTTATEAQEQSALFQWAAYWEWKWPELKLIHAIPNGGSRHPLEAVNLKRQGVRAGIPDIFLPAAHGRYHGLYIEMKRRKGGRVRPEQEMMIDALREQGYRVEVCKGWESARDVLMEYLHDSTV